MKHPLPPVVLRFTLCLLVLAALGGCTIFHPYRIPTPKPSPEYKAKLAADKKAKKAREAEEKSGWLSFLKGKSKSKKNKDADAPEEAATDVAAPINGSGVAPTATASATTADSRTLPERSTVRYDKQELMKKPKLIRRRVNKPTWSFHPWQSIKSFFKYNLHGKPNYSPDHRPVVKSPEPMPAPDAGFDTAPTPDAAPDATPAAEPAAKPAANPNAKPTSKPVIKP